MSADKIYKDLVEYLGEEVLLKVYGLDIDKISKINVKDNKELEDSLSFGGGYEIVSNVAAFVFLVISTKLVELGIEITKRNLYEMLIKKKEKIIKAVKKRYGHKKPEDIYMRIVKFLEE